MTKKGSFYSLLTLSVSLGLFWIAATPMDLQSQEAPPPWVADPSAKDLVNPIESSKKSISKGAKIFKLRCVVCHGPTGQGDGPGSRSLNPKPANLGSERVQNQVDGEIFWKISEGRAPMITWKLIIPEENRWHLVNFIRTLK